MPSILLRLLLALALLGLLWWQLASREQWASDDFWLRAWAGAASWWYLAAVVVLLPLNWGVEVLKWLPLMRSAGSGISLVRAWAAVLSGATVSMFTPNRVGEYAGRLLWVDARHRAWAVVATLLGSLAQWGVLLAGGGLALLYWYFAGKIEIAPLAAAGLALLLLAVGAAVLVLYLRLTAVVDWLMRFGFWARRLATLRGQLAECAERARADGWVWAMAAARYAIYTLQYACMLLFWGLPLSALDLLSVVAVIYLLQTGLPLPPSTGLIARGNIALFVVALLLPDGYASAVLSATFSLWCINVFLPAAAGAVLMLVRLLRR